MSYEERYPNEPAHFNEWWEDQMTAGAKPENVALACAAWNAALDLAADRFSEEEGTSFGVECTFRAVLNAIPRQNVTDQ